MTPRSNDVPIMICNAMQCKDVINQRQSELLKDDYASQANEISLTLVYVSMSPNKTLFPNNCFSYTNQMCFYISFIWFTIFKIGQHYLSSTLIIIELQELQWAANIAKSLLYKFQIQQYYQFIMEIHTNLYFIIASTLN